MNSDFNNNLGRSVTTLTMEEQVQTKPLPKKIGVLYSEAKREYFPTEEQYITEASVIDDAKIVAACLEKMDYSAKIYPGNSDLSRNLHDDPPDLVVNMVDSIKGREDLCPTIPALLQIMEIPFTGTGVLGLSINGNKYFTKKLLELVGVPIPRYQLFNSPTDPLDVQLKFPLISKLNEIHGSVGIDETSVSDEERHLRQRIRELMSIYKQPIIVEEFIVGKEITCILIEGTNRKVYPVEKILPDVPGSKYKLASFSYQWLSKTPSEYIKHDGGDVLRNYIKTAYDILKMDGYAKFDLRLDESGRYYFIDCNANSAFGPKESRTALGTISDFYGVTFEEVLKRIIDNTLRDKSFKITTNGNGH